MRLFRVGQFGYGVQTFEVCGNEDSQYLLTSDQGAFLVTNEFAYLGAPLGKSFDVQEGNYLLAIDMIEDFAGQQVRYLKEARPRHRPEVDELIRKWD